MEQVGMRELRHRLRHYLARADAGEGFEVTVFGRAVAQLGPLDAGRSSLTTLVDEGKVTPALHADTSVLPAVALATTGQTATQALLSERQADAR